MSTAQQQTNLPITKESVLGKVETDWSVQVEEAIDEFITVHFDELFEIARNRVIAVQKQEITKSVKYPDFLDLDPKLTEIYDGKGDDFSGNRLEVEDFYELKPWLETDNLNKEIQVFQEVEHELNSLVNTMIYEIKSQYDEQYSILAQSSKKDIIPSNLITKASIREFLIEKLERHIKRKQRDSKDRGPWAAAIPVYDVFTIINSQIDTIAAKVEKSRFVNYIKAKPVFPISISTIQKTLKDNFEDHKDRSDSEKILLEKLIESLKPAIAAFYLQSSMTDDTGYGAEDPAYLEKLLATSPEISEIYKERVKSEFETVFSRIREGLASKQYDEYFGKLTPDTPLDDSIIERIFFDPDRFTTDTFNGTIYVLTLEGQNSWIANVPLMNLLEETEQKVIDYTKKELDAGIKTFAMQQQIVNTMDDTRKASHLRDVFTKRPYNEILDEWKADLRQRWSMQEKEGGYDDLFNWTQQMINKNVRQYYTFKDIPKRPIIQFYWDNFLFGSKGKKGDKKGSKKKSYRIITGGGGSK